MPTYIMLIGLPGAGKSTWARDHISCHPEMDFQVVSSDALIEERARRDGLDYGAAHEIHIAEAIAEMDRRFADLIRAGANIIHDQTNLSAGTRRRHLTRVWGYDTEAVVLHLPAREWRRRFEQRRTQTGKDIPDAVLKAMARRFELPGKGEGFGKITRLTA